MQDVSKMRRQGTWQIGPLALPGAQPGDDAPPLLVVVEARRGELRAMGLVADGASLGALLDAAARSPLEGGPARPRSIQCPPELAMGVRGQAPRLGCSVSVARRLPALIAFHARLQGELGGVLLSLPQDRGSWRALLEAVLSARPWEGIPDTVLFQLESTDPAVHGRVLSVLGLGGEQFGFAVFGSEGSALAFFAHAVGMEAEQGGGLSALPELEMIGVNLEPLARAPAAQAIAAESLGLVHDGHLIDLFVAVGGRPQPLPPERQPAVLACIQAFLGAFEQVGCALMAREEPTAVDVPGIGSVKVRVRSSPLGDDLWDDDALWDDPEDEPGPFSGVAFQLQFHPFGVAQVTEGPTLVVKSAVADARRAARALGGLDGLEIGLDGDTLLLDGWVGTRFVGSVLEARGAAGLASALAEHLRIHLCVAGGGARRSSLRAEHVVGTFEVEILTAGPELDEALDATAWTTRDPDGVLGGKGWDGPASGWPPASAALLAFAAPLDLGRVPEPDRTRAYEIVCGIWTAVVQADQGGDPSMLRAMEESVRAGGESALPLEALVTRKRTLFAADDRKMMVRSVVESEGELLVRVAWTPVGRG